jgi:hypothetical protein
MLERLLPYWRGKLFVLVLLGFALIDFIITITLSAADASAHAVENPQVPAVLDGQELWITMALIALLGAIFLNGATDAIGVAVPLVVAYLGPNAVVTLVVITCTQEPRACLLTADAMVNDDRGEGDAAEVSQGVFVVAGGDSSPLLESAEPALDGVAVAVELGIERRWAAASRALGLAPGDLVGLLGDGVSDLHLA